MLSTQLPLTFRLLSLVLEHKTGSALDTLGWPTPSRAHTPILLNKAFLTSILPAFLIRLLQPTVFRLGITNTA